MDILSINNISAEPLIFSKCEEDELLQLKQHIQDYLRSSMLKHASYTNENLIQYLRIAKENDKLLLHYLKGRKHDLADAWSTLRMYAENRFQYYPQLFLDQTNDKVRNLLKMHIVGALKNKDNFGRRIVFLDTTKWDVNEYSLDELISAIVFGAERCWRDPEVLGQGLIVVENSSGFSAAHAKQLTPRQMMVIRNVYQSFPISVQGLYYLGMPYILSLIFKMGKNLFPKKLRSRMYMYAENQTPKELFHIASPEILPEWMGGQLPIEEAAEDYSFFEKYLET